MGLLGHNWVYFQFGAQLAKEPYERTCGREERAFAGAKLRPARS